jgi:hypothetical protein
MPCFFQGLFESLAFSYESYFCSFISVVSLNYSSCIHTRYHAWDSFLNIQLINCLKNEFLVFANIIFIYSWSFLLIYFHMQAFHSLVNMCVCLHHLKCIYFMVNHFLLVSMDFHLVIPYFDHHLNVQRTRHICLNLTLLTTEYF